MLVVIFILAGTQGYLFLRWQDASAQLSIVEKELAITTSRLKRQERYTRGNIEKLGQTVSYVASQRPTSPQVPSTTVSKQAIAELLMVESFRLDRLVDWVDLIEDKMYFILFQAEQSDRESASQGLEARTRDIRVQFSEAAQKSLALRKKILTQTQPTAR